MNGWRQNVCGRTGRCVAAAVFMTLLDGSPLGAQTCTTQAKMTQELRSEIADSALFLAVAVQAGDAAKVQSATVPEYASNFGATAGLIHATAAQVAGDTLHVTQIYALDAKGRKAGDGDADFSCPLTGSASETDFSIGGLPPGMYAFAMVEANGDHAWLLAMLLRQEGLSWKMAGFYPRSRLAAGRDGLSYWVAARDDAKAKKPWLAWLSYGQADELLRPANFVSSTNLDKLRTERRAAAPAELADGVGPDAPLLVKGNGDSYSFTSLASAGSDDGKHLNLLLHLRAASVADTTAAQARNLAAAKALLAAHSELHSGFDNVLVFSEVAGAEAARQPSFLTQTKMTDIQ